MCIHVCLHIISPFQESIPVKKKNCRYATPNLFISIINIIIVFLLSTLLYLLYLLLWGVCLFVCCFFVTFFFQRVLCCCEGKGGDFIIVDV